MKGFIRYPGAKWRLADWIIQFFPEHRSYLEPFFGSGAIFFNKPRSGIETVNDLDGEVINLFKCIQDDPEKLANMVHFTPYSRMVYESALKEKSKDSFEQAACFLVRINMSRGFRAKNDAGWKRDVQGRPKAYAAQDWCQLPDLILDAAERLRGVQIECTDAICLIEQFNSSDVLIYCDPPYLLNTKRSPIYQFEMDDTDHVKLLEKLKLHTGPVLISGYDSDLYGEMLAGWHMEEKQSLSQVSSPRKEILWMNFEPAVSGQKYELPVNSCEYKQRTIFDLANHEN